jgi:tRNA1(Val) A37 N6-methylase TrmN6
MVEWVIDHFGVSTDPSATSPTILDVGCGNAHLLMLLAEAVSPALSLCESFARLTKG